MEEAALADAENSKPIPLGEVHLDMHNRPFGGLEFQVSEVVERLEAGVNAQDAGLEEKPMEVRKISAGFFEPESLSMSNILKNLEELVQKTDPTCESAEPPILPTDEAARAAILSHSIAALFGRLERSHAARLGAHIASETTRWIAHMFRLSDYHAYYHQEQLEGLVRVTRMLLHHKYPRYLEDGALAFTNRLPCVYSSVASPLGVVQHLCRQLGLPLACVRPVPVNSTGRGMDVAALERLCDEDIAAGRSPLLVLGEAGAPPLGSGTPLKELHAVCLSKQLHLHLRGHALALPAATNRNQTFSIADSVTLTPGPWFGIPGLPTVTFYKIPETVAANEQSKAVNTASSREGALSALAGLSGGAARLPALPLWTAIRAAGALRLTQHLSVAFRSARAAHAVMANAGLRILSDRPGGDETPNVDIVDAVSGASACVSFQFAAPGHDRPPPYYDKLNSWLGQVLQREAEMISIEVCETESHGIVLRYCPLEGSILSDDRVEELASVVEAQLHVLHATVSLREPFQAKVKQAEPLLRLVHVPGWAGLGGVRYVPAGWESAAQLDALNRQLVDTLRCTDGAFSCGDGDDGLACIRFGMVTDDTDVEELIELVVAAGAEVEDSSRALTTMSEVVKKGIEEAQLELERESARVWQEGVLRRVPVVGRVVQWWAPAAPAPGRRMHLGSGTVQTTTDVYQHVLNKKKETEPVPDPEQPEQE